MAKDTLAWLLQFRPHHPGDPGPEIYKFLDDLPFERQGPVIEAMSLARSELDAVRAKGYAQIGKAVAAAAQRDGLKS